MSIKWTRAALASVDEIAGFIARDNPTRATSFVLELQSAVIQLQAHPGMGRAGRVPGTRELVLHKNYICLLYTSPSPRDRTRSRMPSSA